MDIKTLEDEIAALTKNGHEAILTVHKIEGALQFAQHMLAKLKQEQKETVSEKSE
jgi:hypothetical protein